MARRTLERSQIKKWRCIIELKLTLSDLQVFALVAAIADSISIQNEMIDDPGELEDIGFAIELQEALLEIKRQLQAYGIPWERDDD